jgi:hypothetical protein
MLKICYLQSHEARRVPVSHADRGLEPQASKLCKHRKRVRRGVPWSERNVAQIARTRQRMRMPLPSNRLLWTPWKHQALAVSTSRSV